MSTRTFSGIDHLGRPSSRVHAPPGGRSSNIFGTEPESAPTMRPSSRGSAASAPFATSESVSLSRPLQPSTTPAMTASHQRQAPFATSDNVHEATVAIDRSNAKTFTPSQKQTPPVNEPIESRHARTSVRCHQPPGGRSQITF
eukprot:TRINITY_DN725_c0_g1_i4.p1 TRINITY_DN725_c0_g1~~TRINITY_DN725_c0_g1_i4.p1  ORF type:complete len:143 (+),score=26.30 TRINITY_DN725_c0_g1_i4:66-494(+)